MKKLAVIGGGISGLATAYRITEAFASVERAPEIMLFEAEARVGGKILSDRKEGYLCEWGPNGFLDNRPDTLDLCTSLEIDDRLLRSTDAARRRFIYAKGRLHEVPESPLRFFRSKLLTLRGRVRVIGELWARPTPPGTDTSVFEFGARRIGREATEMLLDPMVSGIFAGDPSVMSLEACFPRIAEMEREYGSLVKAMMQLAKQRKQARQERSIETGPTAGEREPSRHQGGPAGPGGILTSFSEGLETLVAAISDRLRTPIRTGVLVRSIEDRGSSRNGRRYRIQYEDHGSQGACETDAVVVAVPAYAASRILEAIDHEASTLLGLIPYSPLVVVGLGYNASELPGPLDGFGFLIPHREGRKILGSLWCSSIFPGRAPQDHVLARTMVGGYRDRGVVELDDTQLLDTVLGELRDLLGWTAVPRYVNIIRHAQAIPIYTVGHLERLERIERLLSLHQGIYLTGNAYYGVALNDCTREAVRVASLVKDHFMEHLW